MVEKLKAKKIREGSALWWRTKYHENQKEIYQLKKERKELRDCHEAELGVCQNFCDVIKEKDKEIKKLKKRLGNYE